MSFDQKIRDLGITLPDQPAPAANYVPYSVVGNLVFVSGQITSLNGTLKYVGKVGRDFSIEEGQEAAKLCALNILTQVKTACGGTLDRVIKCVRLGGFVNSTDDFTDQPKVINGASNLMIEVFGDAGKHARAAVGVNSLPLGIAVEVDAIFEIKA